MEAAAYPPTTNERSPTMFGSTPQPAFMPCRTCGASVAREQQAEHVCDPEQRARYESFQVRLEVERFDGELNTWLRTPAGRFAIFYAERDRRQAA
jgi:hypothetical protein